MEKESVVSWHMAHHFVRSLSSDLADVLENAIRSPDHAGEEAGDYEFRHNSHDSSPEAGIEKSGGLSEEESHAMELGYELLEKPENRVEAHRMANNYMFGFRKRKNPVTANQRSQTVHDLYDDQDFTSSQNSRNSRTCSLGNVLYAALFGWWISLVYFVIGCVMCITIVGWPYTRFCFRLAGYMIWPFGKFVHKNVPCYKVLKHAEDANGNKHHNYSSFGPQEPPPPRKDPRWENLWLHEQSNYWKRPSSYVWILVGFPLAVIVHSLAFFLTWITVVFIPMSKINLKVLYRILLLPPELMHIDDESLTSQHASGDIIMSTHQALNVHCYKYTVDGVNVICVNLLLVVFFALGIGYLDQESVIFSQELKFLLSLFSIIPLAHYISMAISSISAQTNLAFGAVLNATFGSIVEIILYTTSLVKGKGEGVNCYGQLVKSALVGTLLATTLLIPGLSMVVGGWKHQTQTFNYRSAGITATLLFVSVAGAFAPSIFSRSFGEMTCTKCNKMYNPTDSDTWGLGCEHCELNMHRRGADFELSPNTEALIYGCCILLPLAYIIGLIYSLKTHHRLIYETFVSEIDDNSAQTADPSGHHSVHWGRIKSFVILGVAVVLMSLCAELVTQNIEPIITNSGLSVYFVGALFLGVVPEIPEILVGIQFALQNNIALGIEVGSCVAVQVCMVQMPVLVLADLIHPMNFYLIFSTIHIWAVVIGVLLNNYVFQDGKANYFQGSALVATYTILLLMYFFAPNEDNDGVC